MLKPVANLGTLIRARKRLHEGTASIGLAYDRTGTIDHDGVGVHYYDRGATDAALTVVYVHGFNISSESFYMQVEEVAQLPVRQVLTDIRGHGRTGAVAPELCNVDDAADDVFAVLTALGVTGPVIVVGHSLGGPVSLSLMRRYSSLNIVGSVQISSTIEPFADQGMPQMLAGPIGKVLGAIIKRAPGLAETARRIVTDALAPVLALGFYFRPVGYDIVRFHARMIKQTPLATFAGYFDDLISHSELEVGEVLSTIPGYILVGDHDAVTPASQSARLAQIWPRAHFQILPESGHMPPLDAPGAVSTAIVRLVKRVMD